MQLLTETVKFPDKMSKAHWLRKPIFVLLALAIICGSAGCAKSNSFDELLHTEFFDIDEVRKDIYVKGVAFELPKRIGDLEKEWTYEKYQPSPYVDGSGAATFFYNGDEIFFAGVSDFENGDEKDGIIYDVALETSDCSIGGIIPNVSGKKDVIDSYGEPNKINFYEDRNMYRYIYGVQDETQPLFKIEHSQMFTVMFYSDTDIVQGVRVVYTDLLNQ